MSVLTVYRAIHRGLLEKVQPRFLIIPYGLLPGAQETAVAS
ncbi:NorD protein required for nitric oxide reductase (Nor) activity (putative chaperone, ATPase) [Aminomonas paucivorans DSM 12260]|uniref:NorD protein required for nitric oxide reductase (Nor) activity (Putative chaperone, ATPase) n=1 Tax=Aminomonas paucivorans DSM 12260 TaxID=584708 RepID=E3CX46_9BACT|nr:NorD protein required for nitric oxide reductase (Nor) activity (putative chaperone, ATPase) [Aminomonas paucivorans DSM 12260]